MDFFKNLSSAVLGAKDILVEKNRKTALINRLRAVVKCEEQSCERAYMALGRYYYHNLRDAGDPVTEPHCVDIDDAEKRLDAAIALLDKLYNEKNEADETAAEEFEVFTVDDEVTEGVADESVEAAADIGDMKVTEEILQKADAGEEPEAAEEESETAQDGENDSLPFE